MAAVAEVVLVPAAPVLVVVALAQAVVADGHLVGLGVQLLKVTQVVLVVALEPDEVVAGVGAGDREVGGGGVGLVVLGNLRLLQLLRVETAAPVFCPQLQVLTTVVGAVAHRELPVLEVLVVAVTVRAHLSLEQTARLIRGVVVVAKAEPS
jgi:hypothetical protein